MDRAFPFTGLMSGEVNRVATLKAMIEKSIDQLMRLLVWARK